MAADFNKPTVSGEYTDIPTEIRDNFAAAVTMHETDASTNKPTGAKQITADGNINRWSGSAWVGIGGGVPSGAVMPYAGAAAPTGWLLADGSAVSRTTYAALFAAIGVAYGAGDGTTTFLVPDLRGRTVIAPDTSPNTGAANRVTGVYPNTLAGVGGGQTYSLGSAELGAHDHSFSATTGAGSAHSHAVTDPGHGHTVPLREVAVSIDDSVVQLLGPDPTTTQSTSSATTGITIGNESAHTHSVSGTTGSVGLGTAHGNMQPYLVLNYIIKT